MCSVLSLKVHSAKNTMTAIVSFGKEIKETVKGIGFLATRNVTVKTLLVLRATVLEQHQ